MPLVYHTAILKRALIIDNALLEILEVQGFAKCVARKTCMSESPISQYITVLTESLKKQLQDFNEATDLDDQLEALADIRNVAGLLFLALNP